MGSGIGKKLAKLDQKLGGGDNGPGIMERIERLETSMQNLVGALNQSLKLIEQRLSTLEEVLDATVGVIGPTEVQGLINQRRQEKAQAQCDMEKAALEAAIAAGTAVATDKVAEGTLIIGIETTADGEVVMPGRAQLLFSQVNEGLKEQFLGKAPGTKLDLPAGGTFEISEVYTLIAKPPETEAPAAETPATDPAAAIEADLSQPAN